ncbi:uncharacterized protein Z520_08495 [Fonsecaea multimorphosa CBS 102226]|uniref:Rhodopsin domain-containing protein n=1 Tax=Fonsecaea multimorphosa CBS 102226 TaxID=1442371 RepID=A0A0D2JQZ9_9EURO|nr:uncharacterized protein Z520_08495 [Fonsecaea multimorphosa CBS 102226]KIX95787.1 hypothetical protein Z520_08495 [Fonsecaea multimorphosa CBS 102226]
MAGFHSLFARVPLISATHRGPVVNLVAWTTVTTMCLSVVTVLISKLVVLRRLAWKDAILITAMVFSIGFTIAINQQVSGGLGSEISTLSADQYEKFQKAGYAWNILYTTSLSFGKISTLSLLLALSPNKSYRIPMWATGLLTIAWTVTSIIASAFQCSLPHPYLITTNKCFSQVGFWDAVAVIDILIDVALMAMPVWLVYNLQLPIKKKIAVCFAFSFRILAIACTIWRMSEMHRFFDRSADITFESWLPTIATILEVFFSVFAACVPHLRPFMESIQAGYLSGVIQEGDGRFGYGNDSYLMGKMATHNSKSGISAIRSQALKSELRGESLDLPRQGATIGTPTMNDSSGHGIGQALTSTNRVVVNKVSAGRGDKEYSSESRHRSESITSDGGRSHGSDGSKAMIIKTTKEWSVSYQDV